MPPMYSTTAFVIWRLTCTEPSYLAGYVRAMIDTKPMPTGSVMSETSAMRQSSTKR